MPTSVIETNGDRVSWSYDATHQLTAEHRSGIHAYGQTFTYDALGNRLTKEAEGARTTSTYDAASQLVTSCGVSGITTYTFANGNQCIVEEPSGDRTTSVWNYDNRQTLVCYANSHRVTMAYNAAARRIEKTTPTGTTRFIWDASHLLQETDAIGATFATATGPRLVIQQGWLASLVAAKY